MTFLQFTTHVMIFSHKWSISGKKYNNDLGHLPGYNFTQNYFIEAKSHSCTHNSNADLTSELTDRRN
jgi:hypothetical protein